MNWTTKQALLRPHIVVTSVILALVLCVSGISIGAEYAVKGQAIYDLFNSKGAIVTSITNNFEVAVKGSQWRIATSPVDNSSRLDCAYDSECIRTLFAELRITRTNKYWANSATIERRDSPSFEDPFLQTLWLGYCSKQHLEHSTNNMIEPTWTQDDPTLRPKGYRTKATWELDDGEPRLPLSVTFLNDGFYRGYDRRENKPIQIRLPAPFDMGYTSAVYYASSVTNLPGLSLPAEFVSRTFRVPLGGAGERADVPRDTMLGVITNASSVASLKVFRPEYQDVASIHDHRFSDRYPRELLPGGFASYKSRDGRWPEGHELEALVYKFTRRYLPHDVRDTKNQAPSKRRGPVLFVLTAIICVPPFFFVLKKFAQSPRRNKQQQN